MDKRKFTQCLGILLTLFIKEITCADVRVCPGDILRLQCPPREIIVPKSATFGRMEFTECTVVKDFIGCTNDVLHLIDNWCSGRTRCEVNVPNKELIQANTACLPYMRMYLELGYYCLKVTSGSEANCQVSKTLTDTEGVISSRVCTSVKSPWRVTAVPGQKIQLKIIDFGSEQFKIENKTDNFPIYGYIQDGQERVQFGGSLNRERPLYRSESSDIAIALTAEAKEPGILIKYQKIGCPDLSPPAHAWYKRDGDQAVIGCEWSQKTWHLSCDGYSWSGVVGNCSEQATVLPSIPEKEITQSSALWLVCVISISVVLMVAACVIGVVCIKKYRIKQDVQKSMTLQRVPGQGHYDLDPNIEMASMLYLPYKISEEQQQQQQQQGTLSDPHRPTSYLIPQDQVVNELTPIRIWERPLPDLPDKPLASSGTVRSGRTPGDGDEAVDNHEGSTMHGHECNMDTKPLHADTKYSSLS